MPLQFLGYALPGTVMFLIGVGWCWGHALPARPSSRTTAARRHKTFPGLLRLDRHPVQGVLKLVVSLVGIVGSLFAAYPDGSFQYVGDMPFATVYLFFALSGAVDVLACYWPDAVSRGHARLVLALAFLMEAFLFYGWEMGLTGPQSSAEGRFSLQLLVGVIVTCGLATALCAVLDGGGREVADAVRCAGCVVHATWLYHCGVLLYWPLSPTSASEAGASVQALQAVQATQWVTLCFAWHCAAAASLLLVFLVGRRSPCSRKRRSQPPPPPLPYPHPFGSPLPHGLPALPHGHQPRGPSLSPSSPQHSCVLCDASTTNSYHRSGSLVLV